MINYVNKLGPVKVGESFPVRIMGILNTSPESFYKKSIKTTNQDIKSHVIKMQEEGADFIDIGGMSTAPYLSTVIPEKTEAHRITSAIRIVQKISNLPISVDTCRAEVAKSALELGAEIINDISGLQYDKKMIAIVKKFQPSLVLCPFSRNRVSGNPVTVSKNLLQKSMNLAKRAGISKTRIVLDPAIGFFRKSGKGSFFTKINYDWVKRDLTILQNLNRMKINQPVLVSVSNKSFIGALIDQTDPSERLAGSLAAEVFSVIKGANIIRTHNVSETKSVISIAQKLSRTDKSL